MVNKEILGGLKSALERGQSLRQAMMSFYNAGYIKQEIEEAARALQLEQQQIPVQEAPKEAKPKPVQITQLMKQKETKISKEIPVYKPKIPTEKISRPVAQPVVQRVSAYEEKKSRNIIIIILIVLLILLLGILGAIIFFRKELLALFGKLFTFWLI